MNKLPDIITIDGPAGSGKSTIGEIVARKLGYLFFDTGSMYRAVTLAALDRWGHVDDEAAVTRLAETIVIDVRPPSREDKRKADVLVDNQDVTWEIRSERVDNHVSPVSAYPGVRAAMSAQQRRIGLRGKVVMVGRDIGTVVLPEAELKIYLDASLQERARRRYAEVTARGETIPFEAIMASLKKRDEIDSTRAVAPLRPAEDAVIIDSDPMTIDEVVSAVMKLADPML